MTRPTMALTTSPGVVSATFIVVMYWPSRNTVTRSQLSKISTMRCEM